ncbi:MAG: hypothetical protein NXI14_02565 [bacterium]|nr:hypothetical protein [bacterium]
MNKQRKRTKTRRPAPKPSPQAQHPVPPAGSPCPLSESERIETILVLWETPGVTIADIAGAIGMASRDLIALLKRLDVRALLDDLTELLELRSRHTALRASTKAVATLEAVQEEAELASRSTPVTEEAIQAERQATTKRNQRRLAACAVLSHLRSMRADERSRAKPPTQPERVAEQIGAEQPEPLARAA